MPICNPSSAWGIISNQALIEIVSIVLLLIILYLGYNAKSKLVRFGLFLIIIGGASNLYERFANNCVTDYIKVVSWWPNFNIADGLIATGIILVIVSSLYFCHPETSSG